MIIITIIKKDIFKICI